MGELKLKKNVTILLLFKRLSVNSGSKTVNDFQRICFVGFILKH